MGPIQCEVYYSLSQIVIQNTQDWICSQQVMVTLPQSTSPLKSSPYLSLKYQGMSDMYLTISMSRIPKF